jgi:hypothetical protein
MAGNAVAEPRLPGSGRQLSEGERGRQPLANLLQEREEVVLAGQHQPHEPVDPHPRSPWPICSHWGNAPLMPCTQSQEGCRGTTVRGFASPARMAVLRAFATRAIRTAGNGYREASLTG